MVQLTETQAMQFAGNKEYEKLTEIERFQLQLSQEKLCMPFAEYQRCAEIALQRPVLTHEFSEPEKLLAEFQKIIRP